MLFYFTQLLCIIILVPLIIGLCKLYRYFTMLPYISHFILVFNWHSNFLLVKCKTMDRHCEHYASRFYLKGNESLAKTTLIVQ
jgi:hypothetical protein